MKTIVRHSLTVAVCASVALACKINEIEYVVVEVPAFLQAEKRICDSPFVKPDLTKLKECGSKEMSKGHCYDRAKQPTPDDEAVVDVCEGNDVCVADKMLLAGGAKAKACTFFVGGKPGACISLLAKSAWQNKDLLQQDVCDEGERCAPCIDPRYGTESGACKEGGVHEAACKGGKGEAPIGCCHLMGLCVDKASMPEGAADKMKRDSCPENKVCAPASQVEQRPVKCSVLGISGVCLDACFASELSAASALTRSSCGPTELCVPCEFAKLGSGQNMLGCEE